MRFPLFEIFLAFAAFALPALAQTGCRVNYVVTSSWQGGFNADVSITNLGNAVSSWTVTWTFGAAGQRVSQAWNAAVTQSGQLVTARNVAHNANLGNGASTSFGFTGAWTGSNPVPSTFTLNGITCTGGVTNPPPPPTTTTTLTTTTTRPTTSNPGPTQTSGPRSMGFIGCSMAENVASGYVAVGGQRMWGPYGTGGMVVQSWTNTNSQSWQLFDQQSSRFGRPSAVWVQICIFSQNGATMNEVRQLIANARQHAASGATIYISGQPLYEGGNTCFLAGANGPELTDNLAQQAAQDSSLNVIYPGRFWLGPGQVSDGCHANSAGEQALGRQALAFFG